MPNGEDEFYRQEDAAKIAAKIARLEKAAEVASYNIIELSAQRDMLAKSLGGALDLVNHLMADLRHAGVTPTMPAVVAKAKLDVEMRALLARYGSSLPSESKPA
jgi:hypothetical protein